VQDRRVSQTCRLERVAGCGIIAHGEAIVPIFIDRGAPPNRATMVTATASACSS